MKAHEVKQGECLDSIAMEHGLFPDTVWDDPANDGLRQKRPDRNVLMPGDVLQIPDPKPKEATCHTGSVHCFRRRGVPAKLRLRFLRDDGPRKGESYSFVADGAESEGVTDDDGYLEQRVMPNVKEATVTFGNGESFVIALRNVDPIDEPSGQQARLANLGFYSGPLDGKASPELTQAVMNFQVSKGMPHDGTIDQKTKDALVAAHGS